MNQFNNEYADDYREAKIFRLDSTLPKSEAKFLTDYFNNSLSGWCLAKVLSGDFKGENVCIMAVSDIGYCLADRGISDSNDKTQGGLIILRIEDTNFRQKWIGILDEDIKY